MDENPYKAPKEESIVKATADWLRAAFVATWIALVIAVLLWVIFRMPNSAASR
ncbi:MAG TPA: hypothetical protein VHC22_15440 [Pirellulales bacterium]|nr:hypothetical protein [Pirellulales bacterium]